MWWIMKAAKTATKDLHKNSIMSLYADYCIFISCLLCLIYFIFFIINHQTRNMNVIA